MSWEFSAIYCFWQWQSPSGSDTWAHTHRQIQALLFAHPTPHMCNTRTICVPYAELQAFTPRQATFPHDTHSKKLTCNAHPPKDSCYANNTHDTYPTEVAYMPQTTHPLHTLLIHYTHIPQWRLWGSRSVKILLREKCSMLATEATSPSKLHKDFSKSIHYC